MFQRYKIYFTSRASRPNGGRPERDVNADLLKRFVAQHGLAGELDRILPSSAFGIVEVNCTSKLADRVKDMPEVETVIGV